MPDLVLVVWPFSDLLKSHSLSRSLPTEPRAPASGCAILEITHMDEQEFKTRADEALTGLYKRLASASDEFEFETDFSSGALAVEFESPPGKFVISPNAPVRQIWVSAHSKSFKLDWDSVQSTFVLPSSGQTLAELVADAISQQIGEEVSL
jgi:iron donor protein CyaY